MDERPGRSFAPRARPARWALGAALAALAFVAIGVPWQRTGGPLLARLRPLPRRRPRAAGPRHALRGGRRGAPADRREPPGRTVGRTGRAAPPPPRGRGASPARGDPRVPAEARPRRLVGGDGDGGRRSDPRRPSLRRRFRPPCSELSRSLFSPGAEHAAFPLRAALVHAAGLLGFLLFRRVSAQRGAGTLVLVVVGGLALVGAYAVLEASTGLKLWGAAHYEALSSGLRVPATLPDYNATGSAMALGLFPALVLARRARGASRLALAGAVALLLAGLILSGSRGAWLATLAAAGAALAGVLWSRRGEWRNEGRRLVLGAGLALGISVVAIAAWPGDVGQLLRRRAATLVDPGESLHAVQAGRVGFWKAGARMVGSHPLTGVGPGRVPARFDEFRDPDFPVRVENLHNYFLQAIAENGVPGGLLVLWPFVPLVLLAGRLLSTGAAFSSPESALAPGLLAFSLTGLASHPWLLPELQFLFWGAAALLPAGHASVRSPGLSRGRPSLPALDRPARCGGAPASCSRRARREAGSGTPSGARSTGTERYFWTGPRALVPVAVPEGTVRQRPAPGDAPGPRAAARSSWPCGWTADPSRRSRWRIGRGTMSSWSADRSGRAMPWRVSDLEGSSGSRRAGASARPGRRAGTAVSWRFSSPGPRWSRWRGRRREPAPPAGRGRRLRRLDRPLRLLLRRPPAAPPAPAHRRLGRGRPPLRRGGRGPSPVAAAGGSRPGRFGRFVARLRSRAPGGRRPDSARGVPRGRGSPCDLRHRAPPGASRPDASLAGRRGHLRPVGPFGLGRRPDGLPPAARRPASPDRQSPRPRRGAGPGGDGRGPGGPLSDRGFPRARRPRGAGGSRRAPARRHSRHRRARRGRDRDPPEARRRPAPARAALGAVGARAVDVHRPVGGRRRGRAPPRAVPGAGGLGPVGPPARGGSRGRGAPRPSRRRGLEGRLHRGARVGPGPRPLGRDARARGAEAGRAPQGGPLGGDAFDPRRPRVRGRPRVADGKGEPERPPRQALGVVRTEGGALPRRAREAPSLRRGLRPRERAPGHGPRPRLLPGRVPRRGPRPPREDGVVHRPPAVSLPRRPRGDRPRRGGRLRPLSRRARPGARGGALLPGREDRRVPPGGGSGGRPRRDARHLPLRFPPRLRRDRGARRAPDRAPSRFSGGALGPGSRPRPARPRRGRLRPPRRRRARAVRRDVAGRRRLRARRRPPGSGRSSGSRTVGRSAGRQRRRPSGSTRPPGGARSSACPSGTPAPTPRVCSSPFSGTT